MSTSKIKIKMGPITVECEGSESFLKEELPLILKSVSDLYQSSGIETKPLETKPKAAQPSTSSPSEAVKSNSPIVGTTSSIAGKLSVKSGQDLILASAARLTFGLNKERFNRKDIHTEMKSASAYYKTSYGANLSTYLNNLIKDGTFLETSSGVYAISAAKATALKSHLD
jgi:hypothetical protein